jgi:hypothetical protein
MKRRRGVGLIWAIVMILGLCAVASFAVDFARVQIVKTQLRAASDAAGRAAAHDIPFSLTLARADALAYARKNKADGQDVILDPALDIEFGKWEVKERKFKGLKDSEQSKMNAVRVTARRLQSRGTGVPLVLAGMLGMGACDVKADTITMILPGLNINQNVPATANPFLSGMPAGSVASLHNEHNSPDYAGTTTDPKQSPLAVNMVITGGDSMTFDSINGTARHDPKMAYYSPDGQLDDIGHNSNFSENGIADMTAPINSLVGVYLNDNQPNLSAPPQSLNFSTAASRDFDVLQPQLKQLFFIGDGMNSRGIKQQFIAPQGATRLYLATWDFFEWNNNAGYRNIRVNRPEHIVTVK